MAKPGPKFTAPRRSVLRGRRPYKMGAAEPLSRDYLLVDDLDEQDALRQFRDVVDRWRF